MQDTNKMCYNFVFKGFNTLKNTSSVGTIPKAIPHTNTIDSFRIESPAASASGGSLFKPTLNHFEKIELFENQAGVKYYARPYDISRKLLINLDWLTLRLKDTITPQIVDFVGDVLELPNNFQLEVLEGGAKGYRFRANVFWHTEKVGILCFDSYVPNQAGSMTFKLENHLFYDSFYKDEPILDYFIEACDTTIKNIVRLDICLDGVDLDWFMDEKAFCFRDRGFHRWEQLKVKNLKWNGYEEEKGVHNYFEVSKRGAPCFGQYYNKTEEIKANEFKKQYILDYFQRSGLDTAKDIKRFEIRLNSEAIRKLSGFSFDMLKTNEGLAAIFKACLPNWFEFTLSNEGGATVKTKSHRPKLQFFNLDNLVKKQLVKVNKKKLDGTRTNKILIKKLLRYSYFNNSIHCTAMLNAAYQLCTDHNLYSWLGEKSDQFYEEFDKEARKTGTQKKVNDFFFSGVPMDDMLKDFSDIEFITKTDRDLLIHQQKIETSL